MLVPTSTGLLQKPVGVSDIRNVVFFEIRAKFSAILALRLYSNFHSPSWGLSTVDLCRKIRHTSSSFRPKDKPKYAEKPNFKFTHLTKLGAIRFKQELFHSGPQECNVQGWASDLNTLRWCIAAILAKKANPGSSSGQTVSRNMTTTRFSDSTTPTSYTLWGLSRTTATLPGRNFNISPL